MSEHIIEVEYDTFNGTYTHERPDSLERIADEIENADVDGCTDWADRIRRLAAKEDKR